MVRIRCGFVFFLLFYVQKDALCMSPLSRGAEISTTWLFPLKRATVLNWLTLTPYEALEPPRDILAVMTKRGHGYRIVSGCCPASQDTGCLKGLPSPKSTVPARDLLSRTVSGLIFNSHSKLQSAPCRQPAGLCPGIMPHNQVSGIENDRHKNLGKQLVGPMMPV